MLAEFTRQANSSQERGTPQRFEAFLCSAHHQIPNRRFCAAVYQALTQHALQGGLCSSNGAHAAALPQEAQQHVHCPIGGGAVCLHLLSGVQDALQQRALSARGHGLKLDDVVHTADEVNIIQLLRLSQGSNAVSGLSTMHQCSAGVCPAASGRAVKRTCCAPSDTQSRLSSRCRLHCEACSATLTGSRVVRGQVPA